MNKENQIIRDGQIEIDDNIITYVGDIRESEGEIIDAINSPLHPMSIDAIKRRTRAGMGRCQGGFCMLKVMEIIAREKNMSIDEINKENEGSRIIVGDID